MKLVIVESPTKANTISKFLPKKEYKIESSYGHVRDLPRGQLGVDTESGSFDPQYVTPRKAQKRVTELKKLALKSDEIILASDEDREGEAIAWHLAQIFSGKTDKRKTKVNDALKERDFPISRIVFHEITKSAIEHAIANPRSIATDLVNAQQARRVLDRLVGYKLSPFLWQKVAKGLSAGRVQSAALRLIVDREREIEAFKPQEYWTIAAQLLTGKKEVFEVALVEREGKKLDKFDIVSESQAQALTEDLRSAQYTVRSVTESQSKRNPSPPFTTSTLQQQASNRLRFSAKQTMRLAQTLYEKGLITYMRTDSVNLSKESTTAAQQYLQQKYGSQYALENPRFFKGKSRLSQEAHEAIRPTTMVSADELKIEDSKEKTLYDLIFRRFLASQMPEARFDTVTADVEAKGKESYGLKASGIRMSFDGWLKVMQQKFEEKEIPKLQEGETLECKEVLPDQHFTEPPPRFSEARLIKTLEENGIGRPSTYVPIISVIQERNYVEKDAGKFKPTEIGMMVNDLLVEHFPAVVDLEFTAKLEEEFDEIAEGKKEWHEAIKEFYGPFAKNLEEKLEVVDKQIEDELTDEICEKCSKPMVIKFGRYGKFLACTGFPDCKNAKPLKKNEPKKTGIACPECTSGELLEKTTHRRKSTFWGCSNYPDCDFATWTDPTKEAPTARTEEEKEKARAKRAKKKKR
ncbi:MAG: type I DNA topoisomerase [Candidatus Harrisonbacteria bacterium]|nr:type I DNA topoisomerase [Candidatus Harrisonbacteria bacterium]